MLLMALGLAACSSIDIFKENTEIPIRKPYKTFVIINKELDMPGFNTPELDEMVKSELQAQLEASGMVYERERPDLVIRYHSNEDPRKRETVNNFNPYPFWGYRVYNPWVFNPYTSFYQPRVSTSNYELLQVILDFIDPVQDKYLMTLTAVTEVSSPKGKKSKVLKSLQKATETFISLNNPNLK